MAQRSDSKSQKRKKSNTSGNSFQNFLNTYWQEKSPILKFILSFAGVVILFYMMYYNPWFEKAIKAPILAAQAIGGATILNLLGYSVEAGGSAISGSGGAVMIAAGCDGLEATALFLAAILVFPLPFKFKWPGLLAGFIVLSLLNLVRIAGLFLVQKHYPDAFDFMHIQGGLYLFSIITILLMLIWADWALKGYRKQVSLENQ